MVLCSLVFSHYTYVFCLFSSSCFFSLSNFRINFQRVEMFSEQEKHTHKQNEEKGE